MAYLKLENITKKFGEFTAVNDISLEAEAGDFVVLLGPSGCGKSTLLRLITGLTEEHTGEVFINGRNVTDLDPKDRKVAMVFQSYALYPHLTVAKNISFGMEINKVPKAERDQKVMAAAEALQLETLLDRRPAELSGGQRQRVAIGRCLVREPDLFLFDEPLSNLDAKLRHETRAELKQLHQRLKTTTVYVTHDQHEAMTLATKVVLMKDGELVQTGTPMQLYKDPINRFAATFIGTPQINLLSGEIKKTADDIIFTAEGMQFNLPKSIFKTEITDGAVDFGIRCENGQICKDEEAHCFLQLDYSEPTGADTYLNGTINGQPAVVRVDASLEVKSGDSLPIKWNLNEAVMFATNDGCRL